jgi:hypothetical protein
MSQSKNFRPRLLGCQIVTGALFRAEQGTARRPFSREMGEKLTRGRGPEEKPSHEQYQY